MMVEWNDDGVAATANNDTSPRRMRATPTMVDRASCTSWTRRAVIAAAVTGTFLAFYVLSKAFFLSTTDAFDVAKPGAALVVIGGGDLMMLSRAPQHTQPAGASAQHWPEGTLPQVARHDGHFRPLLHYLSPLLWRADHVFANVEGTFGTNPSRHFVATWTCCAEINTYTGTFSAHDAEGAPLTDYGRPVSLGYHYPAAAAVDFARAGVTVGATANNHAFDRSAKGVSATLDALGRAGIAGVGTSRAADDVGNTWALLEDTKAPRLPDVTPWYTITESVPRGAEALMSEGARPWRVAWISCTTVMNRAPVASWTPPGTPSAAGDADDATNDAFKNNRVPPQAPALSFMARHVILQRGFFVDIESTRAAVLHTAMDTGFSLPRISILALRSS